MNFKTLEIEVYDKQEKSWTNYFVQKISENHFRMTENDPFNYNLLIGTEFKTEINSEGKHEIIEITKKSDFTTRRFFLTNQFKNSEYELLGDAIIKNGGFWQVDLGSYVTINLPKNSKLNLDEIFEIFNFKPVEIIENANI